MSTSTLLLSIPVIVILAALVRVFWMEILVTALIVRLIFTIAVASFSTALIWGIGVENDKEGFWNWWIFFAIVYTAIAVVIYLVTLDIISASIKFIRKLFR